jgi:hypothetical protein
MALVYFCAGEEIRNSLDISHHLSFFGCNFISREGMATPSHFICLNSVSLDKSVIVQGNFLAFHSHLQVVVSSPLMFKKGFKALRTSAKTWFIAPTKI